MPGGASVNSPKKICWSPDPQYLHCILPSRILYAEPPKKEWLLTSRLGAIWVVGLRASSFPRPEEAAASARPSLAVQRNRAHYKSVTLIECDSHHRDFNLCLAGEIIPKLAGAIGRPPPAPACPGCLRGGSMCWRIGELLASRTMTDGDGGLVSSVRWEEMRVPSTHISDSWHALPITWVPGPGCGRRARSDAGSGAKRRNSFVAWCPLFGGSKRPCGLCILPDA